MKCLLYFNHETKHGKEINCPSGKEMHQFIIEYGDKLCKGNALKLDSTFYCKDNLYQFIYDMYQHAKNEINLEEVYNHFHDELLQIQHRQSEIMNGILGKIESNKSKNAIIDKKDCQ